MSTESGGIERRLRESGLKVTAQRRAVWSAFERASSGHLTADEVFDLAREDLPDLARATVYNALSELVRAGLLQIVERRGALLYDRNLDPDHHHFRCRYCGALHDVHVEGVEGIGIRNGEGFYVEQKYITLEGICSRCAASEAAE